MVFLYPELSYQIRGACFSVYKELGSLHRESIYQRALIEEFGNRKILFKREVTLPVKYQSSAVGVYRADFVVEDKIILEVKATKFNVPSFEAQLFHYLSSSPYKLAFLVNFGVSPKVYIKRWVLTTHS